jgi:hypothetical protein
MSTDQIAAFGDWKVYLMTSSSPVVSTKAVSTEQTDTHASTLVGGATAYSSDSSTKPSQTKTEDSTVDDGHSATSQISSSAPPYDSTFAAPTAHLPSKPGLSPAAIAGTSVVSILVISSIIAAVFFLSRRFRRSRHGRADTPPPYVPEMNKDIYFQGKPELDAQYSEVGTRTPVGHAELDGAPPFTYELDGASPVTPMRESAHVSASESRG